MSELYLPTQVVPFLKTHKVGRLDIEGITVKLMPYEWDVCDQVSGQMWANKKGGHYGKGLINSEEDPRRAERIGKIGEMAFAKISGLGVDVEYKEKGDDYDFITPCGTIDIKTSSKIPAYKQLLITGESAHGKAYEIKSDIFIAAFLAYEDRLAKKATVVIVGWCTKEEAMKGGLKKGRAGRHKNYEVHYRELRPISELLTMINPEIETQTVKEVENV